MCRHPSREIHKTWTRTLVPGNATRTAIPADVHWNKEGDGKNNEHKCEPLPKSRHEYREDDAASGEQQARHSKRGNEE
jgi:hypothetical protein